MPRTSEHETVQARGIASAYEIGWAYVPREEPSGGVVLIPTVLRLRIVLG